MKTLIENLKSELSDAKTPQDLDNIKSKYLGKKSELKSAMDSLGKMPAADRAARGAEINAVRTEMENAISVASENLKSAIINQKLKTDTFDMTLPGQGQACGARHPVSLIEEKCIAAMARLGFEMVTGPEVEEPKYNFDLLDIAPHHPARDMADTFWIEHEKIVLRTHTTSVQSRYMMSLNGDESKLPIRIVSPGRVYRNEAVDATHLAIFHQFEGLMVAKKEQRAKSKEQINIPELKGTITFILQEIFGADVKIRFKPKYYPYTEPSIGADIQTASGKWITIVGAGMVSPAVLRNFGFDPQRVSGLAFGFGTSRLAGEFTGANMRELYGMDLRVFKNLL